MDVFYAVIEDELVLAVQSTYRFDQSQVFFPDDVVRCSKKITSPCGNQQSIWRQFILKRAQRIQVAE
jgi:hypothetical protein